MDGRRAYSVSSAEEIREVKDPGRPNERRLPEGHDSGYLWKAGTFTQLVAVDGGVWLEMETIGLSRPFPSMLGWLIEPIARRVGRSSVDDSLHEFHQAMLARGKLPA